MVEKYLLTLHRESKFANFQKPARKRIPTQFTTIFGEL